MFSNIILSNHITNTNTNNKSNIRNIKCRSFNNIRNIKLLEKIKKLNDSYYYTNDIHGLELYNIIEDTFNKPCKVCFEVKYNRVYFSIYPGITEKKNVSYLQHLQNMCKYINDWGIEYYIKTTLHNIKLMNDKTKFCFITLPLDIRYYLTDYSINPDLFVNTDDSIHIDYSIYKDDYLN
jgi:hypothetical protein